MTGFRLIAPTQCRLGEGPLWHPERRELFWFDILASTLFACDADGGGLRRWTFTESVSAAAWVDREHLLVASETGIWRLHLASGECEKRWDLEADNPATRSNDGRADPSGGFWIGSMGRGTEPHAGAIWRVGAGGPALFRDRITVANAICFAPGGDLAYFTDTVEQVIWRQPLDGAGAPVGEASVFVDLKGRANPDGAVCDAEGHVWNAHWDGWRVVRYAPDGRESLVVETPVQRPTCPAFGGEGLRRLFVTSARVGLSAAELADQPEAGGVHAVDLADLGVEAAGQAERRFRHFDDWPAG